MSSTLRSPSHSLNGHTAFSRTVRMSARPRAERTTTARPKVPKEDGCASEFRPVVAVGSLDQETSTSSLEETHSDTDACGWAKRMKSSPCWTGSECSLATPGVPISAQLSDSIEVPPQNPGASNVTP